MFRSKYPLVCVAALFMSLTARAQIQTQLELAAREFGADVNRYTVEEQVMVPMRDGVRLSTAVIRPKSGPAAATVLIRTPYEMVGELRKSFYRRLFANDYAVVMQNERGTHWSEGQFRFLGSARNDGYDTLSWIAAQPWSNGKVGTYGCSSAAENQLLLGTMRHPAHRAMIAMSAGAGVGSIPGVHSQGLFFKSGVPTFAPWARWYAIYGHRYRPQLPADLPDGQRQRVTSAYSSEATKLDGEAFETAINAALRTLPSAKVLNALGLSATDFETFMSMAPTDARWSAVDLITKNDSQAVPTLNVNTWGDVGPYETLKLFEFQQQHPDQYLIMSGTAHCDMLKATENTIVGERAVGDARLPYEDLYLAWFDHHLKGRENTFEREPKVRAYLMGASTWVSGRKWPLEGMREQRYYLHSGGRANSLFGDGALAREPPRSVQSPDELIADPTHPVPSIGGGCCDRKVFRDQSDIEARHDVLVYSTPAFESGLAVVGEIKAVLHVSTSVKDADIAVKLADVYPDGRAFNLHDTIYRLRYRDGFDTPKPAQPHEVYQIEITGLVTGNYFAPGHRLRVEIAGSNFPNHERNLHTGGRNYDETEGVVAHTRVYHDPKRASYITIPVLAGYSPPAGKTPLTTAQGTP
jgi:uncharacterized protein